MYESVKGKGDTLTQPALFSFSTRNGKKKQQQQQNNNTNLILFTFKGLKQIIFNTFISNFL